MCPTHKAKLTGFCYIPREGDCNVNSVGDEAEIFNVIVNGHWLKALLDTGSSLSMIKSRFVSIVDYQPLFSVSMGT